MDYSEWKVRMREFLENVTDPCTRSGAFNGNWGIFRLAPLTEDIHHQWVTDLINLWPEHSGSQEFPVPAFIEDLPEVTVRCMDKQGCTLPSHQHHRFAEVNAVMWDENTQYGAARVRLCKFMLTVL